MNIKYSKLFTNTTVNYKGNDYHLFLNKKTILSLKNKIKYYYVVKKFEEGRLDNIVYKIYNTNNFTYKFIIKVINNIVNEFTQIKEGTVILFPDKKDIDALLF